MVVPVAILPVGSNAELRAAIEVVYEYHFAYWIPFLVGGGAILVGVAAIIQHGRRRPLLMTCIVLMAAAFAIGLPIAMFFQHREIVRARQDGLIGVIVGRVASFEHRQASGGLDRFSVRGIPFEFFDADGEPGYHRTLANGGVMRSGLCVKLEYYKNEFAENRILRIEVPANDTVAQCE